MRGYAGFDQPELAKQLGVSTTTMSRLENGRAGISDTLLTTAARVCGVPPVFAEVGFAPLARPISNVEARIFEVEQRLSRDASVSDLERRLHQLEERLAALEHQEDQASKKELDDLAEELEDAPGRDERRPGESDEEAGGHR
jgi:transcriptional regulator with XRE-family HTH domain